MKQLNVNVTEDFEKDLRRVMKAGGYKTKSEAVRQAVRQAAARLHAKKTYDFRSLIGVALGGKENPNPRFKTEDDLWS
jgi:Arc/MetJ-type ribon-helix-helix transcriptional regulator